VRTTLCALTTNIIEYICYFLFFSDPKYLRRWDLMSEPIDEDDAEYANGDAEDPLEAALIQHSNGMRIRLLPPAEAGTDT
jgi:hypothetical protein